MMEEPQGEETLRDEEIAFEPDPEFQEQQQAEETDMQTQSSEHATTTSTARPRRSRSRRSAKPATASTPRKAAGARKSAKTTTTKTAKAKKAASPRRSAYTGPLPKASELKLAEGGVKAVKQNRYINIEFQNGYSVRLFPVGLPPKDVPKVRDLMVEWLGKHLG